MGSWPFQTFSAIKTHDIPLREVTLPTYQLPFIALSVVIYFLLSSVRMRNSHSIKIKLYSTYRIHHQGLASSNKQCNPCYYALSWPFCRAGLEFRVIGSFYSSFESSFRVFPTEGILPCVHFMFRQIFVSTSFGQENVTYTLSRVMSWVTNRPTAEKAQIVIHRSDFQITLANKMKLDRHWA